MSNCFSFQLTMNNTLESHLTQALGNSLKNGESFNLSIPTCDGVEIQLSWTVNQKSCNVDHLSLFMSDAETECLCSNHLFYDCSPSSSAPSCKNIFYTILTVRMLLIITGLILNTIIVSAFYKRPSVRKKFPNILLCNQAI